LEGVDGKEVMTSGIFEATGGIVKQLTWLIATLAVAGTCFAGPPRPRENEFFKMEAAGFSVSRSSAGPELNYEFMFVLKQRIQITRVKIEDVTDKSAVLLIEDKQPKIKDNRWNGSTPASRVTATTFPWMYDNKTTKKLFRVTVAMGQGGEMVLTQPAAFSASTKRAMLEMAGRLKKK
jgi:hypothetical protein